MLKYGLGYLEHLDSLIQTPYLKILLCKTVRSHLNHKCINYLEGCPKHKIDAQWMKNNLNWDVYTHLEAREFNLSKTSEQKFTLYLEWKDYMEVSNSWISIYAWKKLKDPSIVHMTDAESSSAQKHSWTTCDGTKLETTSTFPPYKGILL